MPPFLLELSVLVHEPKASSTSTILSQLPSFETLHPSPTMAAVEPGRSTSTFLSQNPSSKTLHPALTTTAVEPDSSIFSDGPQPTVLLDSSLSHTTSEMLGSTVTITMPGFITRRLTSSPLRNYATPLGLTASTTTKVSTITTSSADQVFPMPTTGLAPFTQTSTTDPQNNWALIGLCVVLAIVIVLTVCLYMRHRSSKRRTNLKSTISNEIPLDDFTNNSSHVAPQAPPPPPPPPPPAPEKTHQSPLMRTPSETDVKMLPSPKGLRPNPLRANPHLPIIMSTADVIDLHGGPLHTAPSSSQTE